MKQRPAPIRIAVRMLYAALLLGGLRSGAEALTTSILLGRQFLVFMFLIIIAALGLMAWLIWKVGQGKNWARVTLLVLFLFTLITSAVPLVAAIPLRPVSGGLGVVQLTLQFGALLLLFQKEAAAWFGPGAKPRDS